MPDDLDTDQALHLLAQLKKAGPRSQPDGDQRPPQPEPRGSALDPPDDGSQQRLSAEPPSRRLGQYQLRKVLGRGGMGTVYDAMHILLRCPRAVKVLASQLVADPSAVARFRREMAVVGQLNHPGIVAAPDAGEENGVLFLVMDRLEGDNLDAIADLSEWAAEDAVADGGTDWSVHVGPLPVTAMCEAIRQAAVALDAAHRSGLVHRDIKPSNLLLTRQGVVKVLDMGLAQLDSRWSEAGAGLTGTGQIMGTVDYMAPEQAEPDREVGPACDIYSLGTTLYRLIGTQPPYGGPEYDSTLKKLTALGQAEPPPLESLRPSCPPMVAAIVRKAMARDPEDRYRSAAELAQALEPVSDLKALRAIAARLPRDPSGSYEFTEAAPRRRQPATSKLSEASHDGDAVGSDSRDAVDVSGAAGVATDDLTGPITQIRTPIPPDAALVGSESTETPAETPAAETGHSRAAIRWGLALAAALAALAAASALMSGDPPAEESSESPVGAAASAAATDSEGEPTFPRAFPAGVAADRISRAGDGTGGNAPGVFYDSAIRLYGDGSRIELPPLGESAADGFTLELWFRQLRQFGGSRTTVLASRESTSVLQVVVDDVGLDSRVRVEAVDQAGESHTLIGPPLNPEYHHLTLQFAPREVLYRDAVVGQLALWIDGREWDRAAGVTLQADQPLGSLAIGASEAAGADPFGGDVVAVRMSRGTLYARTFSPPKRLTSRDETLALYDFGDLPLPASWDAETRAVDGFDRRRESLPADDPAQPPARLIGELGEIEWMRTEPRLITTPYGQSRFFTTDRQIYSGRAIDIPFFRDPPAADSFLTMRTDPSQVAVLPPIPFDGDGEFTVEVTFRPRWRQGDGHRVLFALGQAWDGGFGLFLHPPQHAIPLPQYFYRRTHDGAGRIEQPMLRLATERLDDVWVRLAFVRGPSPPDSETPTRLVIYANGVVIDRQGFPEGHGFGYEPGTSHLGGWAEPTVGMRNFEGDLAEFRISRIARDVKRADPTVSLASDADTIVLYDFVRDADDPNRLTDRSGNGLHGRVERPLWGGSDNDTSENTADL